MILQCQSTWKVHITIVTPGFNAIKQLFRWMIFVNMSFQTCWCTKVLSTMVTSIRGNGDVFAFDVVVEVGRLGRKATVRALPLARHPLRLRTLATAVLSTGEPPDPAPPSYSSSFPLPTSLPSSMTWSQ